MVLFVVVFGLLWALWLLFLAGMKPPWAGKRRDANEQE